MCCLIRSSDIILDLDVNLQNEELPPHDEGPESWNIPDESSEHWKLMRSLTAGLTSLEMVHAIKADFYWGLIFIAGLLLSSHSHPLGAPSSAHTHWSDPASPLKPLSTSQANKEH